MEEIYEYMNQEQITLFMIFDNNEVVKNEYFSDYLTLDSVYWVYDEYPFYYKFNEAEKEGIALTEYNGCTLYFSIRCESEKNLFQHFKNFIVLQKK